MPSPIDTTKVYSNGHKTLGAMEALGLQQLLKQERTRAEYFWNNKETMIRPRNPLTGEMTPREGEGEPIINPNWDAAPIPKEKEVSGKVGIKVERYNILGNMTEKVDKREPRRERRYY